MYVYIYIYLSAPVLNTALLHMMVTFMCQHGFPGGASGKEPACQCRRYRRRGFNSWVGNIPWSRKWQPTPVIFPVKFHGQRNLVGYSP